jgi:hypothetical protein
MGWPTREEQSGVSPLRLRLVIVVSAPAASLKDGFHGLGLEFPYQCRRGDVGRRVVTGIRLSRSDMVDICIVGEE